MNKPNTTAIVAESELDVRGAGTRGGHCGSGYGELMPTLSPSRQARAEWTRSGAKVIARALRDAGSRSYTGLFQTPELVAEAALQEDADAVGLSVLSGAHMTLIPKIVDELRARDLGDVLVFAGGIIPEEDRPALAAAGVAAVFTPGAPFGEIVDWLETTLDSHTSLERNQE